MAVDTQQKRMSASGAGRPFMRAVFPVLTPTEAWRIGIGIGYNGVDVEGPNPFDIQQNHICVVGVGRPWLRTTFPVATPTEAWRMDVGMAYCGNPLNPIGATLISFHQRSIVRSLLMR